MVYVTSLGNYFDIHSGLYRIFADGTVGHIADYVSLAALGNNTLFWLGSEQEFDWMATEKTWKAYCLRQPGDTLFSWPLNVSATTPYGLCVLGDDTVLLSDAGDYFNPGSVTLYHAGSPVWTVTAGVCPGHFAIW